MRASRDVAREGTLRWPRFGRALGLSLQCLDRLTRELREPAQIRSDVPIIRVEPVLVEGVRRRALRVQPDRLAGLALAELRAGRREEQLVGEAVRRLGISVPTMGPTDEFQARRDVAPLVRPAHLHLHAHRPVEMLEVVCLQEHVAEFGERKAALKPDLHGVLGEHVRHREVLAGIAQESDE